MLTNYPTDILTSRQYMDHTPSEKLKRFFVTSTPNRFKKGETILRPGDQRSSAFYLKKGFVKDSAISHDGREFTLFIFKPEDIFSYTWIFNKIHNGHFFKAMVETVIYEKNRESFLLFLEKNPDVQFMLAQNITIRLGGLTQRMEQLAFGNATQKVASIISILGERFGRQTEKGIQIPISLTQQDIAELIGISRETTSIEINRLMVDEIIERYSGTYIIIRPQKLQKLSKLFS